MKKQLDLFGRTGIEVFQANYSTVTIDFDNETIQDGINGTVQLWKKYHLCAYGCMTCNAIKEWCINNDLNARGMFDNR